MFFVMCILSSLECLSIDLFISVKSNTLFFCDHYPKQNCFEPAMCAIIISNFEVEEFNFQSSTLEAKG